MRRNSDQLVRLDDTAGKGGSDAARLKPLFGLDAISLAARMIEMGEPAWRGPQLAEAIYRQRLDALSEFTTLPKALRRKLAEEGWQVGRPRIAQVFQSVDGTERYLVECHDAVTVETVWMPEGDEGETGDGSEPDASQSPGAPEPVLSLPKDLDFETGDSKRPHGSRRRATICVSSQVGCAVNCQFCLTAKLGLQRNLSAGEIAGQVVSVLDRHSVEVGRDRVNLVFMGMGEPLLNYDNFMGAVQLLVREVGLARSE